MGRKNEKTKKTHKEYISCAIDRKSGGLDSSNGQGLQNNKKLDSKIIGRPCSANSRGNVVYYPPAVKALSELAREFYWCDEQSFHQMRVPYKEAWAFAQASYTFLDAAPDIFNFLTRVRVAQRHARRYCSWMELHKKP